MNPTLGRVFLGVPVLAFGLQHLVYGDFVTRVTPRLPAWAPWPALCARALGVALVVAGFALLTGRGAVNAARLLGAGLLASALLRQLPLAAADPFAGGLWTNAGKTLALAGGALVLAGLLAADARHPAGRTPARLAALDRLAPLGRYFFSAFLVASGVQHFIYPQFVATLVPAWIGGAVFWTYFAGVALIVAGTGIVSAAAPRLAARAAGLMIFAWLLLLHVPRALANVHDSNETTAAFEALAMSGIAFLIAASLESKSSRREHLAQRGIKPLLPPIVPRPASGI